jgi:hypothetical protein
LKATVRQSHLEYRTKGNQMKIRLRGIFAKIAVLLAVAGAALVATASPAAAMPSGCSSGIRYNLVGSFQAWYAWANCSGGTGHYQVIASCWWYNSPLYLEGPVKTVGQGESRVACPHNNKPTGTGVSMWN